ncbi:hypothetical protein MX659_02260 [Coriobacteriia bacterium Es71-Z0120]|uniref:hypothetical protein n=1 Tax=Parvivirga hydrogeniphila TaxID=2939460 RepID=UPI002260C38F|nr:hypothetical protein [Parvivirga hydrogeniphila]MCL4078427.1 hypothetical protein [Parvivirga hydrogeniphila]
MSPEDNDLRRGSTDGTTEAKPDAMSCGSCRYWWNGSCRRRAPIGIPQLALVITPASRVLWPATEEQDFCFEWQRDEGS